MQGKRITKSKIITSIEYSPKQDSYYIFFADFSYKIFTPTALKTEMNSFYISISKKTSTTLRAVPFVGNIELLETLTTRMKQMLLSLGFEQLAA